MRNLRRGWELALDAMEADGLRGGDERLGTPEQVSRAAKRPPLPKPGPSGNQRVFLNSHDQAGPDWIASCFPHDRAHNQMAQFAQAGVDDMGSVVASGLQPAADDRGNIMVRDSKPRQYHPSHCNSRGVPTDHQYDETARLAAAIEALGCPTPLPRPVDRSKGPTDWQELEEVGGLREAGFQVERNRRRDRF